MTKFSNFFLFPGALLFALFALFATTGNATASQDPEILHDIGNAYTKLTELKSSNDKNQFRAAYNDIQTLKKEIADLDDPQFTSEALGLEAMLYILNDQHKDASILLDRAIFIAQQHNIHQQHIVWLIQRGKLQLAMGKLDDAIASYENAVLSIRMIDSKLLALHPLIDNHGQIYYELADLYLRKAKQQNHNNNKPELIRSAVLAIENRRATELNDYFQSECMTLSGLNNTNITDKLDDNSIFLYPIVYPDRFELIFGTSNSIDIATIKVGSNYAKKLVLELRESMENTRSFAFKKPASALYDLIVAPVAGQLTKHDKQNLVIIPDIELINIPWAALFDNNKQQYLVEQYSLAVLPSLNYTPSQSSTLEDASVLFAGLSEMTGNKGALLYVEDEIHSLQAITKRGSVILNKSFTRKSIVEQITGSNFTIHHLATHATLKNNFKDSYISTYDGPLSFESLLNAIASNKYNHDSMDMVVLNGCSTASSEAKAALGLAGLTVRSGIKTVLGTLWQVNDEAAMIVMTEFYKNLNKQQSKSLALRDAQLHVLQKQDNFKHPAYWSAFLIVGNWL